MFTDSRAAPSADAAGSATHVPALRKGLRVLELLALQGELTMSQIQRGTGLNKSMTYRLLGTLRECGYVEQDGGTHRFRLGLAVLGLGQAVAARLDLAREAQPMLNHLRDAFDETMNVGVLTEFQVTYVAMAESRRGLRMAAHVGARDCAHATGIGKVILAFSPDAVQARYLATCPWPRVTPKTVDNAEQLRAQLAQAHRQRFAVDDEENEVGARCVAVPILDGDGACLAGLSASGPAARISGPRLEAIVAELWTASEEIRRRLGHGLIAGLDASK